jgi:hypothetical protein
MDSDDGVYLGVWTNWSRGYVFGATLTLTRFKATLVIAFTSFFVGFVGTRFWRIICLLLHRYYSKPRYEFQDALHHQRQLILRNSESAESSFFSIIRLSHAWRNLADKRLARTLPTMILSAFTFAGFVIAGGFSSLLSTGIGTEVLIEGSNCGFLPFMTGADSWDVLVPYALDRVSDAANYAQQCYSSGTVGVFDCERFVVPRLPTTLNFSASCPFPDKSICKTENENLYLETVVDSNTHLGLNTPEEERVQLRTTFHCAPLSTEGRSTPFQMGNTSLIRYDYGALNMGSKDNLTSYNFTYQIETVDTQYTANIKPRILAKNFLLV